MIAGSFILMHPIKSYTERERERIADVLSGIAADIKKGASIPESLYWEIYLPEVYEVKK